MAFHVFKPGQGYWTRVMSAVAGGLVTLMGGMWLADQLDGMAIEGVEPVYVQAAGFILAVLVGGSLIYWFIARKARTVEFLIATEGEMKKVNWSTRREILGSTWVVIGLTIFVAVVIAVLDQIFFYIFNWMNVIEGGA